MIINRLFSDYYSNLDKDYKKDSDHIKNSIESLGIGGGIGIGSHLLSKKLIRRYKDKSKKKLSKKFREDSKNLYLDFNNEKSRLKNKYLGSSKNSLYKASSKKLESSYRNKGLTLVSKAKDSILELDRRVKGLKIGGKIGSGLIGLGTGLGTYYLLNKK